MSSFGSCCPASGSWGWGWRLKTNALLWLSDSPPEAQPEKKETTIKSASIQILFPLFNENVPTGREFPVVTTHAFNRRRKLLRWRSSVSVPTGIISSQIGLHRGPEPRLPRDIPNQRVPLCPALFREQKRGWSHDGYDRVYDSA